MRWVIVLLLVACRQSKDTVDASAPSASSTASTSHITTSCLVPWNPPPGAAIDIREAAVPRGHEVRDGQSTIVADRSACGAMECVKVTSATFENAWSKVAAIGPLTRGESTSPHYTGRYLVARWDGGRCEIADDSSAPLVDDSNGKRFYDAYDFVAAVLVHARDSGS